MPVIQTIFALHMLLSKCKAETSTRPPSETPTEASGPGVATQIGVYSSGDLDDGVMFVCFPPLGYHVFFPLKEEKTSERAGIPDG